MSSNNGLPPEEFCKYFTRVASDWEKEGWKKHDSVMDALKLPNGGTHLHPIERFQRKAEQVLKEWNL